jgi:hypothetical protein
MRQPGGWTLPAFVGSWKLLGRELFVVAELARVDDSWESLLNLSLISAIVLGVGFDPSPRRKTRWLGPKDLGSHRGKD